MVDHVEQLGEIEHVRQKTGMYIGSTELTQINMWIFDKDAGKMRLEYINISPAWYKIIDEIIVNAIDRYIDYPDKVKYISIKFTEGEIMVYNRGAGFNLDGRSKTQAGEELYYPELATGHMRTSDKYNNSNAKRITGGTNGIGMKATNIFSDYFTIVTSDGKKKFTKKYYDGMRRSDESIIEKSITDEGYTRITFLPSYKELGYDSLTKSKMDILENFVYTRAIQAAAFIKIPVFFNKERIVMDSFADFCKLHLNSSEDFLEFTLSEIVPFKNNNHVIKMGIALQPEEVGFNQISLVNGINVYKGGTHVDHFSKIVAQFLKNKCNEELEKNNCDILKNINQVKNQLFMFFSFNIVDAIFDSQTKEDLKNTPKIFANYTFSEKDCEKCWNVIGKKIFDRKITKKIKNTNQIDMSKKKKINVKYEPATSKKNMARRRLILVEGDSAAGPVIEARNSGESDLNQEEYGIYAITGVPINALRNIKTVKNPDEELKVLLPKLKSNEKFMDLLRILNLDTRKKYDPDTEKGRKELKELKYGGILVLTDQDLDGHNICGMIITNIYSLWPNLAKINFVKKINTPIVRAMYKSKTVDFYSIREYEIWAENTEDSRKYEIKYFKGLAGNTDEQFNSVMRKLDEVILHLPADENHVKTIDMYYGHDSSIRKEILYDPVPRDAMLTKNSTISEFFWINVKDYQRYNISRKIPHLMDGFLLVRRKCFYGSRKIFGSKNNEMKVAALAGSLMNKSGYHHGDAPLAKAIIKMAQCFRGGRNLPFLLPIGGFGSFQFGGSDAGQARYISTKVNAELANRIFPPEDDWFLNYSESEGQIFEPDYYCPILPMALLEYCSIPAHGWSTNIFPRDIDFVVDELKRIIRGEKTYPDKLPIWLNHNTSKIIYSDEGEEIASEGRYEIANDGSKLTITELPVYTFSRSYCGKSKKTKKGDDFTRNYLDPKFHSDPEISPNDRSTSLQTNIEFSLKKELFEDLKHEEIVNFFCLRKSLKKNINFIDTDGKIQHFDNYEDAFMLWFKERKRIYELRFERERIILTLKIRMLENIIRFSTKFAEYGFSQKMKESEMIKILEDEKYDKINVDIISSPKFTKNAEIEEIAFGKNAKYSYLLDIPVRNLSSEKCEVRKEEKKKLEDKLQELLDLQSKCIAKKWIEEIDELYPVIKSGVENFWGYIKSSKKRKKRT